MKGLRSFKLRKMEFRETHTKSVEVKHQERKTKQTNWVTLWRWVGLRQLETLTEQAGSTGLRRKAFLLAKPYVQGQGVVCGMALVSSKLRIHRGLNMFLPSQIFYFCSHFHNTDFINDLVQLLLKFGIPWYSLFSQSIHLTKKSILRPFFSTGSSSDHVTAKNISIVRVPLTWPLMVSWSKYIFSPFRSWSRVGWLVFSFLAKARDQGSFHLRILNFSRSL